MDRKKRKAVDKTIREVINEEDEYDDEDEDEEQDFETYSKNLDAKAIAAAKRDQSFAEGITEKQLSLAKGDVKLIDEEIKAEFEE